MPRRRVHRSLVYIAAALAAWPVVVRGDPPLLQQLSDQTQQLYATARLGMVRVRLPTPQWLARENRLRALMVKWGPQLDPAVREKILEEEQAAAAAAVDPRSPATGSAISPVVGGFTTNLPGTDGAPSDRVLIATGLLIDAAGHAVFPLFIDRADLGELATLPAMTGDGRATVAAFVGSDRNTNLTVLKVSDAGGGRPAPLDAKPDAGRPVDGSLAMVVSPDGSAHLTIWTAASTDVGLVLRPDGAFAGFGFADDFVAAGTARPLVEQLVATGVVRRPILGVRGVPVRRQYFFDPATAAGDAATADGPSAVFVRSVEPDSAAAHADLRPGDVILAVAGRSVGPRTFAAVIAARRGATVLRVRRGAQTLDLTVDLRLD